MVDTLSPDKRSWNMAQIRSRHTRPELTVRSLLHNAGYRFRIKNSLPGKPDLVLAKYGVAIFVHGCFWHRHKGCTRCTTPSSNREFWTEKFKKNVRRDRRVQRLLEKEWRIVIIWECELKNLDLLRARLIGLLLK